MEGTNGPSPPTPLPLGEGSGVKVDLSPATTSASERRPELSPGVQPRATAPRTISESSHFHDHLFRTPCRGGIAAFEIAGAGRSEAARKGVLRFLAALRMVRPATTLGDVYSLVLYPAMSTHRDLSPQERAAAGIGDGLLRLSVGIEDVADILADLEEALNAV